MAEPDILDIDRETFLPVRQGTGFRLDSMAEPDILLYVSTDNLTLHLSGVPWTDYHTGERRGSLAVLPPRSGRATLYNLAL
jgi:hypothetical protein